jgi:hypothetical protein
MTLGHSPCGRRDALALLGAFMSAACAPREAARVAAPAAPPLRLQPLTDLVPAAGLVWLVHAQPGALYRQATMGAALDVALAPERFEAFARRHGGVDLRGAAEVTVAGFPDTTLALARLPVEPARIEKAFTEEAAAVEGRASEQGITRLWGTVHGERQQVALLGRDAVAVEWGRFGPLQAACYFAQGKLHRARPALRSDPLSAAAERLGDAPVRGFAPGPFEGAWAAGLGGLLRAATALGAAARAVEVAGAGPALELTLVLLGAWGAGWSAAAERLGAAFSVLSEDPFGRLTRLNRPQAGPAVTGDPAALRLVVAVDPVALARGIRDATDASVAAIMSSP